MLCQDALRHPLLRFGMLHEPGVAAANIGGLALLGSWVSTLFVLTLYLQDVRGFSPLTTGLAVCPCGLIVVALAPRLAPPLVTRFGPINVAAAGLASAAVAYGLLQRITADSSYVTVVLPSLTFVGIAFTLGYGPLSIAGTNLPEHEQGVAAGVINTPFQIGPTLMITVVTALVDSRLDRGASTDQLIRAYRVGLIAPLIAAGPAPPRSSSAPCATPHSTTPTPSKEINMDLTLDGRTAVVTGGGRGIGLAIVRPCSPKAPASSPGRGRPHRSCSPPEPSTSASTSPPPTARNSSSTRRCAGSAASTSSSTTSASATPPTSSPERSTRSTS